MVAWPSYSPSLPCHGPVPHPPSALALLLAAAALLPGAALANGPLLGNPVDAVPPIERPEPRRPEPALQIPATPAQQAVQARLAQRVTPRTFDVAGVQAIPFPEIAALLEPLAGKETSVGELAGQMSRITQLYQDRGYVLSFALLQDQTFANGHVVVTVVEGHVGDLRIEGDIGAAAQRLESLARPILAEKPLTRATLERQLNLMRTVPGVRITPALDMPRRADGATELVVRATRQAVTANAGISDMGTGMQGLVSVSANSLTPLGEQVKLTAAVPTDSDDVRYVAGEVSVPLGSDGLALKLDGYVYRGRPEDDSLERLGFDREVRNERLGVALVYPLMLNNRRSLTGTLGAYATRASRDRYDRDADSLTIEQDVRVRAAAAELRYADASEAQSRVVTLEVAHGFDAMGARKSLSNNYGYSSQADIDLDFTRTTLTARQTVALPAGFGLALSATGQYSSDKLPSSEQISFGGFRYAMGYPQGDQSGDKGVGVSLEINRRIPIGFEYMKAVQPYVLADYARTWYNADAIQALNDRHLSSIAFGLRLTDDRRYLFDFNVARPVGSLPLNRDDRNWRLNANYSMFYDGL